MKLNKYMEAPEERMESAHFSPPLSKQRNEFARNIIKALEPKFLVGYLEDFLKSADFLSGHSFMLIVPVKSTWSCESC